MFKTISFIITCISLVFLAFNVLKSIIYKDRKVDFSLTVILLLITFVFAILSMLPDSFYAMTIPGEMVAITVAVICAMVILFTGVSCF